MKLRFQSTLLRAALAGTALFAAGAIPLGCTGSFDPTSTSAQDINGAIAITGTVFDAQGFPLPGVTMHLLGRSQAMATTDAGGMYAFNLLKAGSYSVQPSLSQCSFDPQVVNLNNLSASAVADFFGSGSSCGGQSVNGGATSGSLTIGGTVLDASGNPVPGVKIELHGGAQAFRTTRLSGSYTFHVDPGSFTLSPSGPCKLTPAVVNLNGLVASTTQNFVSNGCAGVPSDAGVADASTRDSTAAGDTGVDAGLDATVDASDAGPDASADSGHDTGADVCAPTTCAAAGVNCGTLADNCGHSLSCGTCTANQTCSISDGGTAGMCKCAPLTTCPAGVCGSIADNCGGTVTCSTQCTGHNTCQFTDGGTSGTCGCTPTATSCPKGDNCSSVGNGCGVAIGCGALGGACASGLVCSSTTPGVPGTCGCTPATTCPTGVICGTALDGCGGVVQCGSCPAPEACNAAGTKCVCTPKVTCATAGLTCGTLTDDCGTVLSCGSCTAPQTSCVLADSGTGGTCKCIPNTVAQACGTHTCGTASDGCGGTVSCGSCNTTTQSCSISDGGTSGICASTCVPKTSCPAGVCGSIPDECGGTVRCGACATGQSCSVDGGTSGTCVSNVCVPTSTCASRGFNCGSFVDSCNVTQNCGVCAAPATCGGGGQPNVCGAAAPPACAMFNAGGSCTPTEQKFVNKSVACYTCLVNGSCLDDSLFGDIGKECGDLPGNATGGAKAGTSNTALCLSKIDCIVSTSCASTDVATCYCGTLVGSACATSSAPGNGACAQAEADGSNHLMTDPASLVSPTLADVTLPAGKADAIFACANLNGCASLCSQ